MQDIGFIERGTRAVLTWRRGHMIAPSGLTRSRVEPTWGEGLSGLSILGPQA